MKKLLAVITIAAFAVGSVSAGEGCCPASKKKAEETAKQCPASKKDDAKKDASANKAKDSKKSTQS